MGSRTAILGLLLPSLMLLACAGSLAQMQPIDPFGRHTDRPHLLGHLGGVVRTRDGSPVDNAQITVQDINTEMRVAASYTNPNGAFEIDNLEPGEYEIVVTSNLTEARQRMQIMGGENRVEVNVLQEGAKKSNQASRAAPTVSVAEMNVPDKAQRELQKAQEMASKGKLDEARSYVDSALKESPNFASALTFRGMLNLRERNIEAAERDVEDAIKADPSNGRAYITLGEVFNLEGRYDEALRALGRGESLEPAAWQAHFEMSRANLGKRDFEAALREITKAASMADKDYPPLHIVRAEALLGIEDYKAAIAELKTYLEREPNGPSSAAVRQQLDRVEAAAKSQ
jgi:tetratricopeptide (TPR) repeat protein